MVDLTIEKLLRLTDDLEDGSDSSTKFRDTIGDETVVVSDLQNWMFECLEKKGANYNRALQDIINQAGERLGFAVDFGVYKKMAGHIGYDGLWKSETLNVGIVVDAKKSTAYQIKPGQIGGYIDDLKEKRENKGLDLYGLFVIGDEKLDTVASTIRGSERRNSIRIVSCQSLFTLLSIMEDGDLSHEQIGKLLLPIDAVNVGEIIELIDSVVSAKVTEETGGEGTVRRLTSVDDLFRKPERGGTGITQWAYGDMILALLAERGDEMRTKDIMKEIGGRTNLQPIDREKVRSKIERYKATAGWALQKLKHKGHIESAGYGKWKLTADGRDKIREMKPEELVR